MTHCPHHPDSENCPRRMGYQAAQIVASCKTDREAGRAALDAMRIIARSAGVSVKSMPDATPSEIAAEMSR